MGAPDGDFVILEHFHSWRDTSVLWLHYNDSQELFQVFSKHVVSTKADETGFLTEAVFIDLLKKEVHDPKMKANIQNSNRFVYEAMATNEDGYFQRDEFRKLFENIGMPDASFAEQAFNAIDTNHDGKLSFDKLSHAFVQFMFCEDEDSPCNLLWGPLI